MKWEVPVTAIKPPEMAAFPPYVQYNESNPFLTSSECQQVIGVGESKPLGFGTVGNGSNTDFTQDLTYRSVQVRSLWSHQDELEWLFERIRDRVSWTNQDFYRFDLNGLNEGIQYLRYDTGEGMPGHYRWHQDYGGGYSSHRKLSVTIQLTDPGEYEGCRLKLFTAGEEEMPTLAQGTGVIFPSWQPHMVTPITKGVRRCLVCWVSGPQFR